MPEPSRHRSSRFAQAARTELKRLSRKRSQLSKRRGDLQSKLDVLDAELEAVKEEIVVLGGLTAQGTSSAHLELTVAGDSRGELLKGARIRELAVPMLLHERGSSPIHYREWLQILEEQGYEVAGKRPEAVFLNQVVRSPLVRATTQSGYYEVDPSAPDQLRKRLADQQKELSEHLRSTPQNQQDLERHQQRQRDLNAAIARTQRELDEALSMTADAGERSAAPAAQAA